MKIAVDAIMLDDRPEGIGVYTREILRQLSMLTGDITVYTSNANLGMERSEGIRVLKCTRLIQPKYGAKAALIRFFWKQAVFPFREALEGKCDIVYNPSHYGSIVSVKPEVITIHDIAPLFYPERYRLQHYYFKYVLPILLKKASAIIAISQNTKNDLLNVYKYNPEKIYVVWSGYDQHVFNTKNIFRSVIEKYEKGKYILIVGASLSHKNIHSVFQAVAMLGARLEHKILIVGGKGRYLDFLRSEARRLNLSSRVKFLGYIPSNELPSLYGGADMLVFASLYEGFGLPPLEAMACGCPVIVSNTSSLPEVCGDAAYYIDPYSTESIAEAICKVARDENLRNHLRQKGLKRAKLFTWDKTTQGVYEVLNAVYRERRR